MELISRADAIKDAESWVAVDEHERHLQKNVIEWLKEFPSVELGTNLAEVGADCISRQQAACKYCHEDSDGYVKPIEKNCHAFISFSMDGWELSLQAKGWHGSAKIKYCPMCGRKLKR